MDEYNKQIVRGRVIKLKTKSYFKNATSKETWAYDDSETYGVVELAKPEGKKCLSLGCGRGRYLKAYLRNGASLVVGADINRNNIKICKRLGADLVLCDIENLPFKEKSMEVIECMAVIEHLEQPDKVMIESKRVANDAASIIVSWNYFQWINLFKYKYLGKRLLLAVRDLLVPRRIAYFLKAHGLLGFSDYALFRNRGFTFSDIRAIYEQCGLSMNYVNSSVKEGIILVQSITGR